MTDAIEQPTGTVVFSRRDFFVGAALASASAVGYAAQPQVAYPRIKDSLFQSWVPEQFGRWTLEATSGVVLPPPDAMMKRLYDNLATRVYRSPGSPDVMMLIAYNYMQDGVLQLHRPEFCYPAGGYRLSPTLPVTLSLGAGREIPASAFTAEGDNRTEQVLYLTRLGESFPRTWLDQRMSVMWANLKGQIPDGVMMRVSLLDPDQNRALDILRDFLSAFFARTPAPLHHLLLGANPK